MKTAFMATIQFWNLARKQNQRHVARLVRRRGVDVLALAECELSAEVLQAALEQEHAPPLRQARSGNGKVKLFTSPEGIVFEPRDCDVLGRMTIGTLSISRAPELLLAQAHLVVPSHNSHATLWARDRSADVRNKSVSIEPFSLATST